MTDKLARGRLGLRYEDISQEGVLRLETLAAALGVVWRGALGDHPLVAACLREAVLPILTELEIEGAPGPFAIDAAIDAAGRAELSHVPGPEGRPSRILLDIVADLEGTLGRTNLPPPANAGARAPAGRVFARHVFTRPFAPPGERRVLALPEPGDDGRPVPEAIAAWEDPDVFGGPPPGAAALAPPEPAGEVVFGYLHTDSNQHVNSLVYPRLFEEAALRRLRAAGRSTQVHAAKVRVGFRKPSFVGDLARIVVGLYEEGGALVAAGGFACEGEDKLRASVRMTFR